MTMENLTHYEELAFLFAYPPADFQQRVLKLQALLHGHYPDAAAELDRFVLLILGERGASSSVPLDDIQEIYTRTFEVQSVTTLDVGYVAFGDDYKRGELLVNLTRELRAVGIEAGVELPDHLSNVLRLLARWQDRETLVEFVALILHPAIERMLREFGPERTDERNALYRKHYKTLIEASAQRGTVYRHAMAALLDVIRADFGLTQSSRPEDTSDFLRSITRELGVEARGEGQRPAGRVP